MYSAFYVSPYKEAVTVSVDGFGDFCSGAWGVGRANEIKIDGPLMGSLNAAFRRAGYEEANCVDCDFALDAGYFGHLGSEAVMLGAGEINQFHSDNESVLTEDLVSMSKIYFYLIQEILNSEKAT